MKTKNISTITILNKTLRKSSIMELAEEIIQEKQLKNHLRVVLNIL